MSPDELAHYRERALIERQRAAEATSAVAADIHLRLARRYETLVELEELDAPLSRIVEIGYPADVDSARLSPFSGRPLLSKPR